MAQASRAIIIKDDKILVMYRNKYGSEYYTLVGGRLNDGETTELALIREVKEETSLDIVAARPVFYELHAAPYNEQFIYLCEVALNAEVKIEDTSEEAFMNRMDANIHKPLWAEINSFGRLPFRTPQLQKAIIDAFKNGFPDQPIRL